MSKNNTEKLKVEILRVREYEVGPTVGDKTKLHDILFRHANLPTLMVTIKADDDKPEHRAKVIREKIEEHQAKKAETIEV